MQTEEKSGPSPQQYESMKQAVAQTYLPAENIAMADDYLKPVDLFEVMLQYGEYERADMLDILQQMGFRLRNIEGDTYIPVKYPL